MTRVLGFASTADDVLAGHDLRGRSFVVTGGTSGLGQETVRALAAAGATVLFTARDAERARATLAVVEGEVDWIEADLLSLASVRRAGDAIAERLPDLDALLANAGIMAGPLRRSIDGFEAQFATNHLAHVVLTARLLGPLLAGGAGRVVVTSSSAHAYGGVELDDLDFRQRPYEGFVAYGQSKTANVLFAAELDRRFRHLGLRAASVHPGCIRTDLGRDVVAPDLAYLDAVLEVVEHPEWKTPAQGAATQVWAATVAEADAIGGRYLEDCGVAVVDPTNLGLGPGVRPEAVDVRLAARLWTRTEELTGERLVAPGQRQSM